jgi:hypothetical protein
MNVDSIAEWLKFVDSPATSSDGMSPADMHSTSVFGIYAQRLRDDIFNYLVVTLPNALEVHSASPAEPGLSQDTSDRDTLLRVFSLVPFDMFKTAVESPTFQIGTPVCGYPASPKLIHRLHHIVGSDQARFKFAKDAIDLRKRARGSGVAEETVVLAFGGGNFGSAVHITKKMKKRPLWKVNA